MYGLEGWKATSKMLSSNFFLCAVISCTHVLLSRFHSLSEGDEYKRIFSKVYNNSFLAQCKSPDAAIVASRDEIEAVLVNCQACHTIQVRHHAGQETLMSIDLPPGWKEFSIKFLNTCARGPLCCYHRILCVYPRDQLSSVAERDAKAQH